MFNKSNTAAKPLASYTGYKRKWQDTTKEEDSNAEESIDEDDSESDISEDSSELSVASLLAVLKESSPTQTLTRQFQLLLQDSLQSSLRVLVKELTTIKELVDGLCSRLSKLEHQ